ncbi:MAG: acyl carrier protein [Clostridia bacterium]|nr:acyl carrier protein [Clostridia bacterium]
MNREEKLLEIAADILDVEKDELTLDSKREDIETFDSLSIVQIIAEMSDAFDVVIPDEKINEVKIEKIGDFLQLL